MCGICGIVSLNGDPLKTEYIKSMSDVISHRGPDDAGYLLAQNGNLNTKKISHFINFTDREFHHISPLLPEIDSKAGQNELRSYNWNIFLGHRRLSIIDLSAAGHQPMSDLSNNIWVAYNGEIYNFKELRSELENLGYVFRSHSDTEVIIYSYEEWGADCFIKFNGMFAFTLWDRLKNRFYLVRDRFGIKPLYYTVLNNGMLIFGSEIKAILEYKECSFSLNYEALLEYFTFQNIFTDRTLYKDIKLLPAGNYIELDLNRSFSDNIYDINYTEYWDFDFIEPVSKKSEKNYLEELDFLFTQAVNRQLVSDVEIGTFLSGGMDTGSITAIAAKSIENLKTFTVGFDLHSATGFEFGFDEREKSEYMSYLFKTEHYEMVLKAGDMERIMPKFAWHLEEPRVGQSYPNYYAANLASRFVKVVLGGTGGDELFGGYPWRYYRAVVNDNFEDYIDKYYHYWQRLIPNQVIKEVFSPIWDKVSHVWTRDIFRDVFKKHADKLTKPEDYVNHSLYFEAKTFLNGLLVVKDKLNMAHSLESRVPFLDNDLVDFAMKLPVKYKLGNLDEVIRINENEPGSKSQKYFQKTKDGKLILRKGMKKYIPEKITGLTKQGFSSPDSSWFKGESIEFVKNVIYDDNSKIYDFFDKCAVKNLVDEHLNGEKNRRLLIWSLLNFNEWNSQFNNYSSKI